MEFDEENSMYYFHARYYNPPTFISRDPLFEKKFTSPYAAFRNNPLLYIDPNGEDEYEFDKKGNHVRTIENKDADIVRVVNRRGKEVASKSYEYGTIKSASSNDKRTLLSINNDANRKDIFEHLADNTKVEWGTINATDGNKEINYVATSFSKNEDGISGKILGSFASLGYTVNEYTHSHPNSIFQFSNAPSGYGIFKNEKRTKGGGDKAVYDKYTRIWNNINIKVYDASSSDYFILGPTSNDVKRTDKNGNSKRMSWF
jgi:hypothetical protein